MSKLDDCSERLDSMATRVRGDGTFGKAKHHSLGEVPVYIPSKNEAYESAGDPRYNATAVQKEISKDKRIGGKEAKLIHSLLKGRGDASTPDLARERDLLEKRIITTSSEALRQALRLRLSKVEDKLQGVRGDAGALVNESTVSRAVIEIKNVAKNLFGGDLAKGLAEWKSDHPDTDYGTLKQISSRVGVGSRSDTSPNYKRADDTYRVKRSSGPNGPDTFFVQSNREECVGDKEFKTKSEAESYARQCAARDAKNPPDEDDYGYGDASNPDYKLNRLGQMIHNLHKRMMK